MLPLNKVRDLISKHQKLEKELSSGNVEKKLFAEKSKEYSDLNDIIKEAKELNINNEWAGSGRALIWKMSFDIIKEHPFFGAGPENLKEALKQTKNKRSHTYRKLTGHSVDKAHNELLHVAAVSGFPALLLYLLFIALIIKENTSKMTRINIKSVMAFAVLAYIIQSLFNISVIAVAPLFWILLGLFASKQEELWLQES